MKLGFKDKTAWDLLDLMLVPLFLGLVIPISIALIGKQLNKEFEQNQIQKDYYKDINQLVTSQYFYDTSKSDRQDLVRRIAGSRTTLVLQELNLQGRNQIMKFVSDADLGYLIPLQRSNLEDTNLNYLWLEKSDLQESNFKKATLIGANLGGSDLTGADFSGANLQGTNLAKVTKDKQIAKLDGAILDDATYDKCTKFPPGIDVSRMKLIESREQKCRYE